jgi:FixJ family two-component response regulator
MCNSGDAFSNTVFIVDDDSTARGSIEAVLQGHGYPTRCFTSGTSFLDTVDRCTRGCALLSLRMPDMDGMKTAAELQRRGTRVPMAFLSNVSDAASAVRAMKLGASDFLTRPVGSDCLLATVETLTGESNRLWALAERKDRAYCLLESLTPREREVLTAMMHGLTNKQIARALGISHRTIEIHRGHIMRKAQVGSLIELVLMLDPDFDVDRLCNASGMTQVSITMPQIVRDFSSRQTAVAITALLLRAMGESGAVLHR